MAKAQYGTWQILEKKCIALRFEDVNSIYQSIREVNINFVNQAIPE